MEKNSSILSSRLLKSALVALVLFAALMPLARSADLPLATASPLAGFVFDDKPLVLPVQRNFQMAMLTASSELGRSCGKMEAYGWRMNQTEQGRVNQIFNTTVDGLRGLGYVVQAVSPASVSRDITMFTADRPDKHFILMWSAGEIGLAMVLCESSSPLPATAAPPASSVEVFPSPQDVMQATLAPVPDKKHQLAATRFSPLGSWYGNYSCMQGVTGATLEITSLHGENFTGEFRFYPTPKNPMVATGRYTVYGQYDRDTNRILINPGKWLERPKNYYNTIIVGSFDPIAHTFSGYFQGISGCTSFEARNSADAYTGMGGKIGHKAVAKKKHKKKSVPKKSVEKKPVDTVTPAPVTTPDAVAAPAAPVGSSVPAVSAPEAPPAATAPSAPPATVMPDGIQIPAPAPAATPVVPAAPAPVAPAPVPAGTATTAPTSLAPSAPAAPTAPTPAPAAVPAPVAPAPAAAPAAPPVPAGTSVPAAPAGTSSPTPAPSKSGAIEPDPLVHHPFTTAVAQPSRTPSAEALPKPFKVAAVSGQYVSPYIPTAQPPSYAAPTAPQVSPPQIAAPAAQAPSPYAMQPVVTPAPPAQYTAQPVYAPVNPSQAPPVQVTPPPETAPGPTYTDSLPQTTLAPQYVPDNGRPEGTPP